MKSLSRIVVNGFASILFAFAAVSPSNAELPYTPLFKWTPPTQFESGADLDPLTDLAEYRVYCLPEVGTQTIIQLQPPYEWEAPPGLFLPGEYECYMTAVATTAKGGGESGASNTTEFTIEPDKPAPVVIFEVN